MSNEPLFSIINGFEEGQNEKNKFFLEIVSQPSSGSAFSVARARVFFFKKTATLPFNDARRFFLVFYFLLPFVIKVRALLFTMTDQ